jgi:hypothetical protein
MCVDSGKQRGCSDQGRDAQDGVEGQSLVPRTRVRPSLPLYLAPLDLSVGRVFLLWTGNLFHSLSLSLLVVLGAASLRLAHTVRQTCVERSCISIFLTVGNDDVYDFWDSGRRAVPDLNLRTVQAIQFVSTPLSIDSCGLLLK